jgi:hypothetical protein
MAKKQLKGNCMTPKWAAGLAGNLLDAQKSNIKLEGLPRQLMRLAARVVRRNAKILQLPSRSPKCWTKSNQKPPKYKPLLNKIILALSSPTPRMLREGGAGNLRYKPMQATAATAARYSTSKPK